MQTRNLLATAVLVACFGQEALQGQLAGKPRALKPSLGRQLLPAAAEVRLGDRLFFETRFAQYFFAHSAGKVNGSLRAGEPLMGSIETLVGPSLPALFRGQAMNCRQCHLGDDLLAEQPFAGRTYTDFSRRSQLPVRGDGLSRTVRNAPSMVDLGLSRETPELFHLDGEFVDAEDLIIDTLTGRNLGWLPGEASAARAQIAKVIRGDEGVNPRHLLYSDGRGIPYRVALKGTDPKIPIELRIPNEYRLDVSRASNDEILHTVAKLIHAYMDSLRFGTRNTLRETESPYDRFLAKNNLPTEPMKGETSRGYGQRLLTMIQERKSFAWVSEATDGPFRLHRQEYRFGPAELNGLAVFFTKGDPVRAAHAGNCVACHTPPRFTDQSLHNNGVSQAEYDAIFVPGAFAALEVPDLATRNARFDAYLPASPLHPHATGRFRSAPDLKKPGYTDLGVWNVFANPEMPKPQAALRQILCGPSGPAPGDCGPEAVLPRTIGFFKTASVRDLGQSDPYFHSGAMDTIEDVIRFYVATSELARQGKLRNGSPEISQIRIDAADIAPLSAFLRSLNEDYR
jgi:cytochrome c peroxidase